MHLDETNDANIKVIGYLRNDRKNEASLALPNTAKDPYYQQGSYPDVVKRLWDQLGAALSTDCRCLVYGSPALVHPRSGVILAFSRGTVYYLRLTPTLIKEAVQIGAKTYLQWTGGGDMNTQRDLGDDWVLGGWFADEIRWCKAVYNELK